MKCGVAFLLLCCECTLYFGAMNCEDILCTVYEGHPEKENVCACSPRTCFVAADHWFLVFKCVVENLLHAVVRRTL